METKYVMLTPEFDGALNVSIAIVREKTIDGETFKSDPWRRAHEKGEALVNTIPTTWGDLQWSDFPAERDYILAKWAE